MKSWRSRLGKEKERNDATSGRGRRVAILTVAAILTAVSAAFVGGVRTASALAVATSAANGAAESAANGAAESGTNGAAESGTNGAADQKAAAEDALRPVAVVASAGYEPVWAAIGRLAEEMKFGEAVEAARAIYGDVQGVDLERPFGFVVATDGSEIVPFALAPVESVAKLEFVGASDWKEKLEKTTEGTFLEIDGAPRLRLLEKDGWLVVFEAGKEALILTIDPLAWLGADAEKGGESGKKLGALTVDVDLTALPEELLEAGFASLRQYVAENAPVPVEEDGENGENKGSGEAGERGEDKGNGEDGRSDEEAALEQLDATLEYYSALIDSLERIRWTLDVDAATGDLVWESTILVKNGSPLAETLTGLENAETCWSAIAETPNALFATVNAGKRSRLDREFLERAQNANVDNLMKAIEIGLDGEEERALAKVLVAEIEKITKSSNGETFDAATAFSCDPVVFTLAATPFDGEKAAEVARKILANWKENDPENAGKIDKFVKFNARTVEGFSLSTLDLPADELQKRNADLASTYWRDKTLAVRFGTTVDSVLLVVGLDSAEADAEFARIAAASKTKKPAPKRAEFAVAPLGRWALETIDADGGTAAARKTFARIAKADDARATVEYSIAGNRLDARYVVKSGMFRLIGDLVRLNLAASLGSGDEGEDVDDLFNEE